MPISFEPTQPFDAGITAAYGASQTFSRDAPSIASMYESNLRDQTQERMAAAQQQSQANALSAQLQQQGSEFQQNRTDRQNAVQFEGNNALTQTAAHYDLQMSMQQQQLSQTENMRLQQLQQARGRISQMVSTGDLTPEEGRWAMLQVETQVNPLQQRQANVAVMHQKLQNQQLQNQIAQGEAMDGLNEKFAAGNVAALPLMTDPLTGKQHRMLRDKNGQWYDPFAKARVDDQKTREGKVMTPGEYAIARREAIRESENYVQKLWVPRTGRQPTADEQANNDRIYMERHGIKPTYAEQIGKDAPQPIPIPGEAAAADQPAPPSPDSSGGAPAQDQPPLRPARPQPPFELGKVQDATPEQQAQVKAWDVLGSRIAFADFPPERRKSYEEHVAYAKQLIASYGGPDGMPPKVREHYEAIMRAFVGLPNQPPAAPGKASAITDSAPFGGIPAF